MGGMGLLAINNARQHAVSDEYCLEQVMYLEMGTGTIAIEWLVSRHTKKTWR